MRRNRPAHPESLDEIAALESQHLRLFRGLHAFAHHPKIERVTHGDDGGRDRRIIDVGRHVAHE
jgi:hypothetical protein